jgi:hypothetical protein
MADDCIDRGLEQAAALPMEAKHADSSPKVLGLPRVQRNLTSSLRRIKVPHEPCVMLKGGVVVFSYVDDVVSATAKVKKEY